jgi:hypothetical protein
MRPSSVDEMLLQCRRVADARNETIHAGHVESLMNEDIGPLGEPDEIVDEHGVGSEPTSTRKSTSLSGPASLRAVDPKTRTRVTP